MRYLNYILLGVGGVVAVVAVAFFVFDTAEPEAIPPQSETVVATNTIVDEADDAAADTQNNANKNADDPGPIYTLSIDLARVKPDGSALFAGQGAPGARIDVFEGDVLLGRTMADNGGEWVVVLEKPLAPGQHLVSVAMRDADGKDQLANISLVIEISESGDQQPLVALLPQLETDPPILLQSPDDKLPETQTADGTSTASAETTSDSETGGETAAQIAKPSLAPRGLLWRDGGVLAISGVSRGGVRVASSIDNAPFAEALVLADGQWQVSGKIADKVTPSKQRFTLNLVLFDEGGQKVASYQLPIKMRDLDAGLDGSEMVVVQRGDALWRIAYRSYGKGVRYVDIVRRNVAAIDDPDLIYPDQIFALPD
ncbi:LysM peptidoglycan-binding domain-containing protein [Alphaproteobacteria bacterium]|nr:LysM peptidoglycan-binding domain-containing protein [Alphaproteobacteria bacterium]